MDDNNEKQPEITSDTSVTPPEPQTTAPVSPATPVTISPTPPKSGGKKLFGKIGMVPAVIIAVVLLVGGSAAAYLGIVIPNKPENVLKIAFENTALQKKSKFDGKFTYESTDPEAQIKAVNITFKGQGDIEKNAFQTELEATASGVKLPIEIRSVDKSLFVKVGDLSTIKNLAIAAAPEYGVIIDEVNKKLADQWIEIDETLLKQVGADCALNTSLALTNEDIEMLKKRYQEVPFTAVKSTTSEAVNGRDAYKYEIELDDNKGAEYIKGLQELSVVKKLKECSKDDDVLDTKELADDDITPITLWIDKDTKTLSKFVMNSTQQDEEKSQIKGSLEMTFQFGEAEIVKPEGARPALEVFGELQSLFMGQLPNNTGLSPQSLGAFDIEDTSNFDF
ncbi:hypothetical protein H0X10_04670 [Candidatus Saccharibacteria bacterium]|nr:hypothetical protein [Candidatus Saccharibacteria bacterium]